MIDFSEAPPWLIWGVAITAAATLLSGIYLVRRQRSSRAAGMALLFVSLLFHAALVFGLPILKQWRGARVATVAESQDQPLGEIAVSLSMVDTLDLSSDIATKATPQDVPLPMGPLPIDSMVMPVEPIDASPTDMAMETDVAANEPSMAAIAPPIKTVAKSSSDAFGSELDRWLDETDPDLATIDPVPLEKETDEIVEAGEISPQSAAETAPSDPSVVSSSPASTVVAASNRIADAESLPLIDSANVPAVPASAAAKSTVVGKLADDFAARRGVAKREALQETGGDLDTEAAVERAIQFLAQTQKDDGGWDPAASNAGRERSPLGFRRGGAGAKAETALTGLSLLAMMGSGHTHQDGPYADQVYRGLSRLMTLQKPNGSLAGNASIYSATYCHGMASLALAEAAAMTGDRSAIDAATRAVAFTESMQHPSTGGWRYTKGDPGDLSQLGWQAMVLDAGHRADINIQSASVRGIERFLNTVRGGRSGGLASYRRGELPSRTMTAESMATHLLLGLPMTDAAIAEAQRYLLSDLPGRGVDNYYYWYYATVALHQLQDETWHRWNDALKKRLLATQKSDGSWPASTLWGGYGGTIYTTSMATLCLETYYRHVVRQEARVARTTGLRR